jgi:hypothetical protein
MKQFQLAKHTIQVHEALIDIVVHSEYGFAH